MVIRGFLSDIDTARLTDVQRDVVRSFFDTYLKQSPESFPGSLVSRYPELIVHDRSAARRS